jgi:hypothetical protein
LLTALSTREQWLAELSATKTRLLRQQSALITRIAALDVNTHTKMALALRAELSDIERELNGLHEINSKIT